MKLKHLKLILFSLFAATALTLAFYINFHVSHSSITSPLSRSLHPRSHTQSRHTTASETKPNYVVSNFPKWLILKTDSVALHRRNIEELAKALPDWRILVVTQPNDKEIHLNYEITNCLMFRSEDHKRWMFTGDVNPFNAAFAFVLAHGARVVYESNGLRPAQDLLQLHIGQKLVSILTTGLDDDKLLNHYTHFGQSGIYPRGFPVKLSNQIKNRNVTLSPKMYNILEDWKPPAVQHVVNYDPPQHPIPCNDSVHNHPDINNQKHQQCYELRQQQQQQQQRLQGQNKFQNSFITPSDDQIFDPKSPPILIHPGTFSAANSRNTLYTYKSLWSLIQPRTSRPDLSDVWRVFYTQRLLWEIDETIGFYPPTSTQTHQQHTDCHVMESPHRHNSDQPQDVVQNVSSHHMHSSEEAHAVKSVSPHQMHSSEELVRFLMQWKCPKNYNFIECMLQLSNDLSDTGYWLHSDVILTKSWIQFLKHHGYKTPERLFGRDTNTTNSDENNDVNYWISKRSHFIKTSFTRVQYATPQNRFCDLNPILPNDSDHHNKTHYRIQEMNKKNICTKITPKRQQQLLRLVRQNTEVNSISHKLKLFFSDVLVIIVFNTPHYEHLEYLLTVLRPVIYTTLIVCGDEWETFEEQTNKWLSHHVTFIEFNSYKGHYGYQCATKAMQMGYYKKVRGYFITGDDVIQFWWHSIVLKFDKDKIWTNRMTILDPRLNQTWSWWDGVSGKKALNNVIRRLSTTSVVNTDSDPITPHNTFIKNLIKNTRGAGVVRGISDTYYIPSRYKNDVIYYFNQFYKDRTFLEIAIPVTLWGIEEPSNMQLFGATNLHNRERDELEKFYRRDVQNGSVFTFHPVKLSKWTNRKFFCNVYLVDLLKKIIGLI